MAVNSTKATYSGNKTARVDDGWKIQERWLCPQNRRHSRPKIQSKTKTYAFLPFRLRTFSPAELEMSKYSKEFLAIYMAFLNFAHNLWEATKPTVVLTDNKSVTRLFQSKTIHRPCGTHAIVLRLCDLQIGIESHGEDRSQNP